MKDTVIGIIYEDLRREKVLITKRRDVPVWVLPGGGIDKDESPEQALLREIFEETGLRVAIVRKTGDYTPINWLARRTHVYECERLGGELTLCDETMDIGFYELDQLPASFFFLHQEWLEDARKGSPVTIRRPIATITYWELCKTCFQHPIIVFRALLARMGMPLNARRPL